MDDKIPIAAVCDESLLNSRGWYKEGQGHTGGVSSGTALKATYSVTDHLVKLGIVSTGLKSGLHYLWIQNFSDRTATPRKIYCAEIAVIETNGLWFNHSVATVCYFHDCIKNVSGKLSLLADTEQPG